MRSLLNTETEVLKERKLKFPPPELGSNRMRVYMMNKIGDTREKLNKLTQKLGLPSENLSFVSTHRTLHSIGETIPKQLRFSCKENISANEQNIPPETKNEFLKHKQFLPSQNFFDENQTINGDKRFYRTTSFNSFRPQKLLTERNKFEKSRSNSNSLFQVKHIHFKTERQPSYENSNSSVDYETFKRISQARTRYLIRSISQNIKKMALRNISLFSQQENYSENKVINFFLIFESHSRIQFFENLKDFAIVFKVYISLSHLYRVLEKKTNKKVSNLFSVWKSKSQIKTRKLNAIITISTTFNSLLSQKKAQIFDKINLFANNSSLFLQNCISISKTLQKATQRLRFLNFFCIKLASHKKSQTNYFESDSNQNLGIFGKFNFGNFKNREMKRKLRKMGMKRMQNIISKKVLLQRHSIFIMIKSLINSN